MDDGTASKGAGPIHVALTFNDRFWALAFAVMRSISLTTTRRRDVVFHLCHTALTERHSAALQSIKTEFGATLSHYDPTANPDFQALVEMLPHSDRFPAIVYARMLLDRLLPTDTPRVIYLDCDVMVCRPIERLYDQPMAGHPIAAVPEPHHLGIKKGRDIRTKKTPFDTAEPYFNSGVLLIELAAYRAMGVPARLAEMSQKGWLDTLFYDQDMLNLVFRGNWQPLDWRFNVSRPRVAIEATNPDIVHYTGSLQPWKLWSPAAFHRTYRHVMTNAVYYRFWRERQAARLKHLVGLQ